MAKKYLVTYRVEVKKSVYIESETELYTPQDDEVIKELASTSEHTFEETEESVPEIECMELVDSEA